MRTRTYYRGALLFPLILPTVLWAWAGLRHALPHAGLVFGKSFLYVGAPYLAMVITILNWTRGRTDREVQKAARLSPVIFAAILVLHYTFAYFTARPRLTTLETLPAFLLVVAFAGLLFGYICVGVAEVVFGVLSEAGVIDRGDEPPGA